MYKSQQPPSNDFNFRSLCANTETKCVFAHIRATSGSVVTQVNSHPFVFGRHVFVSTLSFCNATTLTYQNQMHNGAISNFTTVRRDISHLLAYDAFSNVLGSTDSEHAAALYITNLTNAGTRDTWEEKYTLKEMSDALIKTVIQIMTLQQKLGEKNAPNSLNFCTTDGEKMVAIRFRNHATQQPPSLYWSEFAGRTLNQKFPGQPDGPIENPEAVKEPEERIGKHTIIASEPTTYDEGEWNLIGRNCALTVDEFGIETEVPIEYDPVLNAKDPVYG